jgi:hypothetical protein
LHGAVTEGHTDVVKELLKCPAIDVDVCFLLRVFILFLVSLLVSLEKFFFLFFLFFLSSFFQFVISNWMQGVYFIPSFADSFLLTGRCEWWLMVRLPCTRPVLVTRALASMLHTLSSLLTLLSFDRYFTFFFFFFFA